MSDVVVIGAGFGGLAAAIELAAAGCRVTVLEAGPRPGGKADQVVIDGLACDTGPSLLTLPSVAAALFDVAGCRLEDEVELIPSAFRYHFPDGCIVDTHATVEDTLASVERALGGRAAGDLERHLDRGRRVWEASADAFVFGPAPSVGRVFGMGPRAWRDLLRIDAHRTLWDVICEDAADWRLRWLLARYATYNGSDVRSAPGTLSCIAWVELGLGGWGVRGGLHALACALAQVAARLGVEFHFDEPVQRVRVGRGRVTGVVTARRELEAPWVVCNADVAHLAGALLPAEARGLDIGEPSLSGWVGVLRTGRRPDRVGHQVVFPQDYLREFVDLFDRRRTPRDPTVYSCSGVAAHGQGHWGADEALFVMVNAPALCGRPDQVDWGGMALRRLRRAGLVEPDARWVWSRTPRQLERRFPDSRGAIYGAASNHALAAFRRPPNRLAGVGGLALAGGSAHPGGGVPLCLQSGRQAARELLASRG